MKLIRNHLFTIITLGLILFFSLFLRLYSLDSIPLGFHIDEASLGYNGYSLLITGKDENNNKLPLYIDMFGDNRPSGYHYLTIPSIKVFGLTEFATRFPGALFGGFSVIAFFFLAQVLFKNTKISLLSSLLISVAPWSIVLSRASAETIVALFFIIVGYSFLIFVFKSKKLLYFLIASLFLVISFFFYHTPRVFVPLLVFSSIAYLFPIWKSFNSKQKISILGSFFIVSLVSFLLIFLIKGGTGRFSQVNIFGFPQVKLVLEEQLREDGIMHESALASRIFHNKVINYSLAFLNNYSEYFSGKFLFLEGGFPWWYRVPAMGLFYIIELPFILIGLYYLFLSKERFYKLPLIWLILAPITAAFTIDDIPNIQRSMVMFPIIELIAAYGFITFSKKFSSFKYYLYFAIFGILLFFNFAYFLQQYFIQSQVHRNWYRNEGFSKVMEIVKKDYDNYNKIVFNKAAGGVYPLILFYMKYDPAMYQKEGSTKDKIDTGFGKFFFVSSACPFLDKDSSVPKVNKIIYIEEGSCRDSSLLKNTKYIDIYRKEGTKAFRIVYD